MRLSGLVGSRPCSRISLRCRPLVSMRSVPPPGSATGDRMSPPLAMRSSSMRADHPRAARPTSSSRDLCWSSSSTTTSGITASQPGKAARHPGRRSAPRCPAPCGAWPAARHLRADRCARQRRRDRSSSPPGAKRARQAPTAHGDRRPSCARTGGLAGHRVVTGRHSTPRPTRRRGCCRGAVISTICPEMAEGCAFCEIVAGRQTAHIVLDDDIALGFLDVRPLFPGHVLVVPRTHHETLADLPAASVGPLLHHGAGRGSRCPRRDGRGGDVRGHEQHREPERASPACARRAAEPQGRTPRLLLAAPALRDRRTGRSSVAAQIAAELARSLS